MKEHLTAIILDFLVVAAQCWKHAQSAQDRTVFQQDVAVVAWWLAQLRDTDPRAVALEILSPQTKKNFYDYWRSGETGEAENNAFARMTQAIEALVKTG